MFSVYETGLFYHDSYELHANYDTKPDEEQKKLLEKICTWNQSPDRFLPRNVYEMFQSICQQGVEKEGTLARKEVWLCTGIEAVYEKKEKEYEIRYRLKGIPDEIADRVLMIHGEYACVRYQNIKHYVFLQKEEAKEWKKLKNHDVGVTEWKKECMNFLEKQVYSREKLLESFMHLQIPLYIIRPGFKKDGESLELYYYGISLNGSMENLYFSAEVYMELYKKYYTEEILVLQDKICMMEFEKNLKYLEKFYYGQKVPDSEDVREVLHKKMHVPSEGMERWDRCIYWNMTKEDAKALVWENIQDGEELVVLTEEEEKENWRKIFPDAVVCSPSLLNLEWEYKTEKPIFFIWACHRKNMVKSENRLLQFMLRFLPVSREYFFLTEEENFQTEDELAWMEELFYISNVKEEIETQKSVSKDIQWKGELLLKYTEKKQAEKVLADKIQTGKHILWFLKHLDIYEMTQEQYKECRKYLSAETKADSSEAELRNWYQDFTGKCQNNAFMYINHVRICGEIYSKEIDGYFLEIDGRRVPIGFLKDVCPNWRISQRRRLYEWLDDQRQEWKKYLERNFIEFYSAEGESFRSMAETYEIRQFSYMENILTKEEKCILEAEENSMYAVLNKAEDIL